MSKKIENCPTRGLQLAPCLPWRRAQVPVVLCNPCGPRSGGCKVPWGSEGVWFFDCPAFLAGKWRLPMRCIREGRLLVNFRFSRFLDTIQSGFLPDQYSRHSIASPNREVMVAPVSREPKKSVCRDGPFYRSVDRQPARVG
jgi:hypothetical protein